ncbi:MAG: hypothetical protein NTX64_04250 [Elusimicrobia bacterium]|nr:hypothetical protein [Elusimicrobiota bacterium]
MCATRDEQSPASTAALSALAKAVSARSMTRRANSRACPTSP